MDDRLHLAVKMRVSGLDILHGHLKNLMYETEQSLLEYTDHENEEYDQTVDRLHLEGMLDAYVELYQLTYDLSFAIADMDKD
jgi:hypothetical protein